MNKNEFINSKICKDPTDVKFSRWLSYWKFKSEKIVFVSGDFDILHFGNIKFLTQAAEYGDILIVGINNAEKKYIHEAYERAFNVAALHYTDYVIFNNSKTLENLINLIKPNVYVRSSQQNTEEKLQSLLEANNITIKTFVCPDGYSNIELTEKIKKIIN